MEEVMEEKEIARETSEVSGDRKLWAGVALVGILCLYGLEFRGYMQTGHISLVGTGMDTVILGLWVWKVLWKYELILYPSRLVVIGRGIGFTTHCEVDLTRAESYTDKYVKSFFRKTKIRHYFHKNSAIDPNPQRLLCFTEGKKNRLAGIIFKCSDEFFKNFKKVLPGKFLQLTEGVPK